MPIVSYSILVSIIIIMIIVFLILRSVFPARQQQQQQHQKQKQQQQHQQQQHQKQLQKQQKILCIYAYYEKNKDYKTNLEYFLTHGINNHMDYIIVINGNHTFSSFPPCVRVVQRKNSGLDFDAYSHVLLEVINDTSLYTHYIFLNGSVRGPFAYRREVLDRWQDELLGLLTEEIRLVGTTINGGFPEYSIITVHVQSQVFAMDRECLDLLIREGIFESSSGEKSKHEVIVHKEVGMSSVVLKNGWNISCLAKKLQGYDYRTASMNKTFWRDPCYKDAYFGESLDAREILFIKTDPMRNLPIPATALPP